MIDDLLLIIFRSLKDEDLVRASRVCRSWHRLAQDYSLWTALWQRNCFSQAPGGCKVTREQYAKEAMIRTEDKRLSGVRPEQSLKLVVVGSQPSEKTALLFTFALNSFPEEYMPSAFDNFTKGMIVDGEAVEIGLWDTAGQEEYNRLRPLSYAQCDVVVIAFSLVNTQSYIDVVEKWWPEVAHFLPNVPIVLCGTHLEQRQDVKDHISASKGHALSLVIQSAAYVECSARTGENLRLLFETAVRAVRESTRKGTRRRSNSGCTIA